MEAAFRKEGAASLNRNQEVVGGIGCRRVCRFHVCTGTKRWRGRGLGAGGFAGFVWAVEGVPFRQLLFSFRRRMLDHWLRWKGRLVAGLVWGR